MAPTTASARDVSPLSEHERYSRVQDGVERSPRHAARQNDPLLNTRQTQDETSDRDFPVQEKGAGGLTKSESWVPLALQRRSLIAFGITYIVLIIALTVLYNYSQNHSGIVSSQDKLHYLWTYGPTAVFTIIAALWTRVDYHVKQLAPWRSLAGGYASAQQSLSLDYVSPWNVKVLFKAAKQRHFDVSAAVAGTLILQLIIVFSTGLFALEIKELHRDGVPITMNSQFALNPNVSEASMTAGTFMRALAIEQYDLQRPHGTEATFAYSTFNASTNDLPSNASIVATADVLYADVDCETTSGDWTLTPDPINQIGHGPWYQATLNSSYPDCAPSYANRGLEMQHVAGNYAVDWIGNCTKDDKQTDELRWWLLVAHVAMDGVNRTWTDEGLNLTEYYQTGKSTVSIISCQPRLEMRKALVASDGKTMNATLIPDSSKPATLNVTAYDLLEYAKRSADLSKPIIGGTNRRPWPQAQNTTLTELMFSLMNATMPRTNSSGWMDTDFLKESARSSFQSLVAQTASDHLFEESSVQSTGSATYNAQRLVVRPLSFYLIVSLLAVSLCLLALLSFTRRVGLVPRDPGSIAGLSAILASSPGLSQNLHSVSRSAAATRAQAIDLQPFQSDVVYDTYGRSFQINSSRIGQTVFKSANPDIVQKQAWWRPFYFTIPGMFVVLIPPLAAIAALEALYQQSKSNEGIANVPENHYIHFTWVYIPAILVWLINLGFECIYYLSTVIQPYHAMRKPVAAQEALVDDLPSKILIHNAWSALHKRRFAVFFASLAVLLGAILPIAVAGLYTPETFITSTMVPMDISTSFDASKSFYSIRVDEDTPVTTDRNANPLASLILHSNLSFPRGSYEEFAYDEFKIPEKDLSSLSQNYDNVTVTIPAVRGRVNCTLVPTEDIITTWPQSSFDNKTYSLQINTTMPDGCWGRAGEYVLGGEFSSFNASQTGTYHFGKFTGATMLAWDDAFRLGYPKQNISVNDAQYHGEFVTPAQCPRAVVTFGRGVYQDSEKDDALQDVTALHCWPYVEQVQMKATFSLPNLDVLAAVPLTSQSNGPVASVFSEAEIVQNTGYPQAIRVPPTAWSNYFSTIRNKDNVRDMFDLYMEAVIWGKDGIPESELAGVDHVERLLARVEKVYGIIVAQMYNGRARVPAENAALAVDGTFVSSKQSRVVQSMISTRIMEAALAAVFLCCAIAYSLLDTKQLLPQDPCNIAAVASFVAGSKLLDRRVMPAGTEFLSSEQMIKQGILQGHRFQLGWWGTGGEKRFGIDIVDESTNMAFSSNATLEQKRPLVSSRETGPAE